MRLRLALALASLAGLAGCEERSLGVGQQSRISLVLAVGASGAGTAIDFHAFYLKGGAPQTLLRQTTNVTAGSQSVALTIDIAPCLASGRATGNACQLIVDVRLLDASGAPIDSARVGPIDITPGATVQQTVTLRQVATVGVLLPSGLIVGDTATARATLRDGTGTVLGGRPVAWSSSNAAVASVDGSGLVTAVSAGTATISATAEGIVGQAPVTVSAVPVARVTVSLGSSNLTVGQVTQANATTRDAKGAILTGRAIAWTSSNASVATVSASGVVTATGVGSANIVATSEGIVGQAVLSVTPAPVASVTVSLGTSLLNSPNQTTQATVVLKDATGNVLTGRVVAWSSSSVAVATVNAVTGLVTAVAPGSATISATSEGQTGSAVVTVAAATVTIQSVLVSGTQTGVSLTNVAGAIDVVVGIASGAQVIDSVSVRIDNLSAAVQSFGAAGAPVAPVVLSINTASFSNNFAPAWTNGAHSLRAVIYPHGAGSTPTTSSTTAFTLANPDVVYFSPTGLVHTGSCTPTIPSVCSGGFNVGAFPVNYSGAITGITYFFNMCGAGTGTVAPNFVATIPCASIQDSTNNAAQQINVRYAAGYTLTAAPRLFMTASSPGFVPGKPQWTATNYNSSEDNVAPIVVGVPAVTGVTVAPKSVTLTVGASVQLVITLSTNGSPAVTFTYATSDASVATVSANGLVTAVSRATAAIKVTACPNTANPCVATIMLVTVN